MAYFNSVFNFFLREGPGLNWMIRARFRNLLDKYNGGDVIYWGPARESGAGRGFFFVIFGMQYIKG